MPDLRNVAGEVIATFNDRAGRCDLSEQVLHNADFRGMTLEGALFDDADLTGAAFTGVELYWASFFRANLTIRRADAFPCRL
jgi:uncharacterized protein YjbI with pentapeptide repeats